jgi:hypothetical protein
MSKTASAYGRSGLWRSEVGNAGAGADARAYHYCDCACFSGADILGDAIEVSRCEACRWYRFVDRAALLLTHPEEMSGPVSCSRWFGLDSSYCLLNVLGLLPFLMLATYGGGVKVEGTVRMQWEAARIYATGFFLCARRFLVTAITARPK